MFNGTKIHWSKYGPHQMTYVNGLAVMSARDTALEECAEIADRRVRELLDDREKVEYSAALACREIAGEIRKLIGA